MLIDFGFDLAGRRDRRLWRGGLYGVAAAAAEAVPYAVLYPVLLACFAGRLSWPLVLAAAAIILAATVALVLLRARANIANFAAVYGLVADARLNVADHLRRLPLGVFTQRRRAVLAELLTGRFALYQDVVAQVWGFAVVNAALPAFLWLILLAIDWRLGLVALAPVPVAGLAIPWSHRLLSRASARIAGPRDDLVAGLVEQVEGMRELRHDDRRAVRRAAVEARLHAFEREQMQAELAPAPAILAFATILELGFAACALTGAVLVTGGGIPAATLVLFLLLALRFYKAILALGLNLAEIRFARDVLGQVRALMAEPALPEPAVAQRPADAAIRFDAVSFAYDGDDGRQGGVRDIDGHVPAGRTVALVGPSGAGKSTLAHLGARFWDPDTGRITIGGVDLRAIDGTTLARTVTMVLQDVVLFEGTIADNIRLGRPEACDAAVEAAARAAAAHDFVARLPDGYATRLDAEGGPLSGGEKQRLAIARAILMDAPVLVLDEATAHVDPENEAAIRAGLDALMRGRTVLVIAHRLWTVAQADEIWVLDGGRIVQRGTHHALLARHDGPYRRLWDAQREARGWHIASKTDSGRSA